jgi:NDP-sugar pyrophosphorylase family protein
MRAVILVGGEGTRLRPLTLEVPKPIVPVVDRPFLTHQLDLLASAGIRDVVFSVAYRPEKIQAVFGDGRSQGRHIVYAVEEDPLGTGGAIKNAEPFLDDLSVVFNGDVLTDVDLNAVVAAHRRSGARATLVLTPVENPSAYGLVETDASGRVRRFLEKPEPSQITTDTINAGIYVLATDTLALMPKGVKYSVERSFFPELLQRGDHVNAYTHRGYWIDIGTPEKYRQVHRDILRGRFPLTLDGVPSAGGWIHPRACVSGNAKLQGPFYVGPGCLVEDGAEIGPDSVLVASARVLSGAAVFDSVLWSDTEVGCGSRVQGALLGDRVRVGRNCVVPPGAVLGPGSLVSDFSRTS